MLYKLLLTLDSGWLIAPIPRSPTVVRSVTDQEASVHAWSYQSYYTTADIILEIGSTMRP